MTQKTNPDGSTYLFVYDSKGNLSSMIDPLNREIKYIYDNHNRIIKRILPDGSYLSLVYDAAGNLISQQDNLNRKSVYTYDSSGNPLSITWPDGTKTHFEYNSLNQRISTTDAANRVYNFEYDLHNHVTRVEYPDSSFVLFNYDNEGNLLSRTDELGNLSSYEYDPMGRMLATIDPAGARYENTYDAAGRRIAAKDPLGRITAYEYDVLDRVVKTVAPDATVNTADYDTVGNLLVSTNALNQQTLYEYDALNRQVKTTRPNGAQFTTSYDAAGQVVSETDALGNTTLYSYDFAGRRISATNALNHVWQYAYDNAGRLIRTVDPMGGVATLAYDVMDRVVTESDALGRVNAFEYDLTGKRIARTDSMGRRSIFAYDSRDRLKNEVDGEGRIVSYGYDSAGRKTRLTDGAGRVWRWVYDTLGRVVAEIDPLGNEVKSSYDAVGNRILKTNARAQATAYEYDLMNRLVKIDYPDSAVATFAYDALGRELLRSGSAGVVEKTYDVVGNLLSETFVDHNKGWSYSYDIMGNRIQAVSPENETFKYRYDKLYRLIEFETGKSSEKIAYSYDALGRNIEEKRVDSTTANTFDAAGQLLEMKHYKLVLDREAHDCGKGKNKKKEPTYKEEILALRQYAYDLAGNRISMTDENAKVTSYAFDNSNWLIQVVYPNSDVVAYAYNDAGDRTSEQLNDEPVVDYSYDSAGRMLSKGDESFSYDADGNMLSDALATFTWNSDNRLVKVEKNINGCKHDKFRKGHGFDHLKHGKEAVVYEEYTYLPMDWRRVTRKTGQYSIKADRKGNAGKNDDSEQTFVSIYDGDDESHEYLLTEAKYNFPGKCKPKKEDLKVFREFVGGPSADDISHTRYGKLSLAMLKDGLGSTIALTGKEAIPIARINYDAWGNFRWNDKDCKNSPCSDDDFDDYIDRLEGIRSFGHGNHNGWAFGKHFGSKLTPYLYTGRRFSSLTSQYFNRNRCYSPALGRFISKDPIGFNGGMNLYRYADNNPMRWVDPMGLSSCSTPEYKTLLLNLIHVYNGTSVFPYDRSKIENSFNFVNDVSLFLIRDKAVQTNNTMGLIAWNNLNYNAATIEAFSAFGVSNNSDTEVINIILAETNFGPDLYGLTSPIGGRRALVDWNNGQHLGNPVNRSWTITHESGHALGLQHKAGTVMQQANWGDFHFDTAEQTAIEQTLEKQ